MIGPIEQQVVELVCSECDALKKLGAAYYCSHRDAHKYHSMAQTSRGPLAYICKDSSALTPPWCPALKQDKVWDVVKGETETDQVEAGTKLDGLIAEHIMGWKWEPDPSLCKGHQDDNLSEHLLMPGDEQYEGLGWDDNGYPVAMPEYSKDIASAWEVLDKLNTHWFISLSQMADDVWECWLQERGELHPSIKVVLAGYANTPTQAICRAALQVVAINGNISPREEEE